MVNKGFNMRDKEHPKHYSRSIDRDTNVGGVHKDVLSLFAKIRCLDVLTSVGYMLNNQMPFDCELSAADWLNRYNKNCCCRGYALLTVITP